MLYTLQGVLNKTQITRARAIIGKGQFKDGSSYLNAYTKTIKSNKELSLDDALKSQLNNIVLGNLHRYPEFIRIAFPGKIAEPIYAHYTAGMKYGLHVDAAIMGLLPNQFRSDVSCTIFLSDLDEYGGGELVIETGYGQQMVKLPAGDAVLYPSTSLHRVAEVTQGDRIVAVTWVESLVPDAEKRALLYNFDRSVEALAKERPGAKETLELTNILTNLKRRWCNG